MTFPATSASVPAAFTQVVNVIASVKAYAQSYAAGLVSGNVDANSIFSFLDTMRFNKSVIVQLGSTTGLDTYAASNIPGYTGNIITDGTAVVTAMTNCINWVTANFPVDTGGFIQAYKLNADGSRTATVFTPAQTAPLVTLLQTLIGTIA